MGTPSKSTAVELMKENLLHRQKADMQMHVMPAAIQAKSLTSTQLDEVVRELLAKDIAPDDVQWIQVQRYLNQQQAILARRQVELKKEKKLSTLALAGSSVKSTARPRQSTRRVAFGQVLTRTETAGEE